MAFAITTGMKDKDIVFYNPKFRALIEDHLNVLKTSNVTVQPVELQLFWKYEGNFYGLLTELGIKSIYHWIYLRVNGMHHPYEYAKEVRDPLDKPYDPHLIEPDETLISDIVKYYQSKKF